MRGLKRQASQPDRATKKTARLAVSSSPSDRRGGRKHVDDLEREAAKLLTDMRSEVEQLTRRRDAISAQLSSLRDVVAGFSEQPE